MRKLNRINQISLDSHNSKRKIRKSKMRYRQVSRGWQSLPPAGCPSMTTRDISLQYWAYESIYRLCSPQSPCGHEISTDTAALRLDGWRVWATQGPTRGIEGWVTRWTRSRKARSWQKWRQVCGIRQKFQWSVNINYNFNYQIHVAKPGLPLNMHFKIPWIFTNFSLSRSFWKADFSDNSKILFKYLCLLI